MQNVRVIVIGAGSSGISAVSRLIEKGFKSVVCLEAENRIGGRVFTTAFADNVVELGAQWCHGEVDNAVFNIVKDQKVLDESTISYPNVSFIRSSGDTVDNEKCGKLVALCMEILEDSNDELTNSKGSLGSFVLSRYQNALKTSEFDDIDNDLAYELLDYFHKFENSIEASDTWFDTSANGYTHYLECEGHPLLNWRDKGYKTLFNFIMKDKALDVEEKIHFNKEVCNISWSDHSREHLIVKCSDGSSYDCDHVIITVSLGVLKENHRTLFTPQLPAIKTNAIEGLSIGTVDKIFLQFDKPFWHKDWAGFSLLWTKEDSEKIRRTSNAWLEDIFGFYKVDYQPNILCGWIGGPSARKMEALDDSAVYDGCMLLFKKFLGSSIPWTKPTNIIRSSWYANKHFRGSYSFRSVTTDALKTSARDLSLPLYDVLGKPALLFAGEATHDHYYSTVHGAIETGYREADRIAGFYAKSSKNDDYNFNQKSENVPKIDSYDVIVVGAGISGLGAGYTLKDVNANFLILEGSNRVGGRIKTVNMINFKNDDNVVRVDAGAQWIHGRQNDFYKFADKHNMIRPEESGEAEGDYIREDGVQFDDFFIRKIDFKVGQLLEECEKFVEMTNANFPRSIAEFLEEKFKEFVNTTFECDEEKVKAMQLLDWHRKFQIIDNSCMHISDISAKDWGNYSFNGESAQTHINVSDGMSSIADKLHEDLSQEIQLNKFVKLIYWKSEEYPGKSNKILIKCQDGTTYSTNNLICTLSMGVLKQNHLQLFQPPLPKEHLNVIENIGYGTINKIFIRFENRWWDDGWRGLQLLWNEDHNDNSHWTKFISGFDVVYPSPDNTLLAWIGGKGAIEMENFEDRVISNELMKIMRKFLNRQDIPDPTHFYCSRWHSDALIRGAYSFTSRQTDHIEEWENILSQPITFESSNDDRNVILLSGEAIHPQYFSTVHGAFMSGIEQAKKILNIYDQKKTKNFISKL